MHPAEQYIKDVIDGKQTVCKYVRLSCERHVRDLERRDIVFDSSYADRLIKFAGLNYHWKGRAAGNPIILEPWQQAIKFIKYGWFRKDGTRRFTLSYEEEARKQGKTTKMAVEANGHIMIDNEKGAQVYVGATKEEQARLLVNDAGRIAEKNPVLKKRLSMFRYGNYIKRVVNNENASFIAPVGRDSSTQDGFDPSMGIMDEYHAHKDDGVRNVIQSGMASRRQPMMNIITTAGFNKNSPCFDLRNNLIDVLEGKVENDAFFGIIFTLDKDDDWQDPKNYIKANPNLGVSVQEKFLLDELHNAKTEGGTTEVNFKTKNLNIWCDSAEVWIQDDTWMKCKSELPDLSGKECWGGLDLAKTRDVTALTLCFPVDDKIIFKHWFWIPEGALQKDKKNAHSYKKWASQNNNLVITPGDAVDYDYIFEEIQRLRKEYNIRSVAYDPWNSSQLVIKLTETELNMSEFRQGFASMNTPTQEFERKVVRGEVLHDGNEVMRWMMGNVILETDPAGNIKISKKESADKVDGPVSAVMALGEYMTDEPEPEPIIDRW